jgi:YidC/Oxa1 family membrane protein insertase
MWSTIVIEPLFNALIWLLGNTGGSFGLAVILLTLLTRVILIPFSIQQFKAQIVQKKLAPLLEKIKRDFPDKNDQNKAIMELYTTHKANPFAGCLPLIIQLPILIGVYHVFWKPIAENADKLYLGNVIPAVINYSFLGIDLLTSSVILALLAGVFQFLQIYLSPAFAKPAADTPKTADPSASIMSGMKYVLPVMIAVISMSLPASMAIYFIISSILSIVQDQLLLRNSAV